MGPFEPLHESSPHDGRLLEALLHAGVLLIDGRQRCRYASPRACLHCGATDQAALENGWADISAGLGLANATTLGAGDPPLQRGFDLHTATGVRKLRSEVHAFDGGASRYLVLLRERTARDDAYRAHVKTGECHGNRHLIANLVHDAKGPLNNMHLTLALLSSTIDRMDPTLDPRGLIGRCQRYLGVMQTEEHRLSARLNDIHALTQPMDTTMERIEVGKLVREVTRLLRHEARIRDASIDVEVGSGPAWTLGDAHQLQLAFLAFCECVVEASSPASMIVARLLADTQSGDVTVMLVGTGVALPTQVITNLFRISASADVTIEAIVAGRMIIEAHGGNVAITNGDSTGDGFAISLPRAANPALGSS